VGGKLSVNYDDMYGWGAEARVDAENRRWSAELKISFSLLGLDLARRNIIGFNPGRCFRGRDIYVWTVPDEKVSTGWGFAILETGDEAVTARSRKRVQWLRDRSRRLASGRALRLDPDYQRHINLAPAALASREEVPQRARNRELGIMPFGPDHRPTLWVGKSDVWDRRLLVAPEENNVTLREIRQAAFSGQDADFKLRQLTRRTNNWYNAYEYPCPKPVGQIIIALPFDKELCTTTIDVEDGGTGLPDAKKCFVLESAEGGGRVTMRIFVHPDENVIVIDGSTSNMAGREIALTVYRHEDVLRPGQAYRAVWQDSYDYSKDYPQNAPLDAPVAGKEGNVVWVRQDFPGEKTFPDGFCVCLAGSACGGEVASVEVAHMQRNLGTKLFGRRSLQNHYWREWQDVYNKAPGSAATIRIQIKNDGAFTGVFSVVTTRDARSPVKSAVKLVQKMLSRDIEQLRNEYANSKRSDYIAGYDYTGDIPGGCTVGSTIFCDGDSLPWHGDFHFNEVADPQQQAELFVRRRHDEFEPYFQMIEEMMPAAKRYARHVFECPGAVFPISHFPVKMEELVQANLDWDMSMEMSAAVAKPFWLHYLYLHDEDFLRKRAYPVISEVARFYADYLTAGDDGYYHVIPTVSPEHWMLSSGFRLNRDCQAALALIKYHLGAAARAANILGEDRKEALRWKEMADRMAPYPTCRTPRGDLFVDVAGAPPIKGLNITVPLSAVFWGDDIGLDTPGEVQELARRTLDFVIAEDRGHFRETYRQTINRRLGIADGLGTESLLQSYNGIIRIFPAVPENYTGGFENWLAVGAFGVSASIELGGVTSFTIVSNAGERCRVANPWQGSPAEAVEKGSGTVMASGDGRYLEFDTAIGKTYLVRKAHAKR